MTLQEAAETAQREFEKVHGVAGPGATVLVAQAEKA